jgi:hypothetical protein
MTFWKWLYIHYVESVEKKMYLVLIDEKENNLTEQGRQQVQWVIVAKTVQIVICCFFAKNAVLMSKLEIWLARNQNNESNESGMSAC